MLTTVHGFLVAVRYILKAVHCLQLSVDYSLTAVVDLTTAVRIYKSEVGYLLNAVANFYLGVDSFKLYLGYLFEVGTCCTEYGFNVQFGVRS